jgi:serine/threonine-protein kinase OSR1/STK39
LLISPDGTILLADFGVGGDINDTSPVEKKLAAVEQMRFDHTSLEGSSRIDGAAGGLEDLGRRKSFVGTVRLALNVAYE